MEKMLVLVLLLHATGLLFSNTVSADNTNKKDSETKTFKLPFSSLLSDASKAAVERERVLKVEYSNALQGCGSSIETIALEKIPALRMCQAEVFYKSRLYKALLKKYPVTIGNKVIGGVNTEVFNPIDGVPEKNRNRVLINLHSGGFKSGARIQSHKDSIPIASIGKIKVISIDYRLAPEYQFPAATQDVVRVYSELLKHYKPENIGIFGSSAGAILTAQSVAWFQKENLPLPAAIGMFYGAASPIDGDSMHITRAIYGFDIINYVNNRTLAGPRAYFRNVDFSDPLVAPTASDEVLAKFPPSLLITASRDFTMSTVIYTHSRLQRVAVEADLHLWEGLGHYFHHNVDLAEAREANNVIVKFFDRHLGVVGKRYGK